MVNKKKETLEFAIKTSLILIASIILLQVIDLKLIQNIITTIVAFLVNSNYKNNYIIIKQTKLIINNYCTGFYSISLFSSIIIPLKKNMKKKLLFLFFSGIGIFSINIARISLIALTLIKSNQFMAELIHVITWFLMALIVFILSLKFTDI